MQFHANQSHFHKNGFALTLALKQRHKRTRKWPINLQSCYQDSVFEQLAVIGQLHEPIILGPLH